MANFQHQNFIQQRRYCFGKAPQVGYGTPLSLSTSAPTLNEIVVTDKNIAKSTVKTYNNRDQSTGVDIAATEQWIDSHDVTVDHTFQTSYEQMGRVLLLAMGGYSVSGSVAPFVHTFTPQDVTGSAGRQLPCTTYVEQTNGGLSTSAPGIDRIFPDCVCEKFSIKGDAVSRLEGSFTLRGSGRYITPSAVVFPPLASPNVNPMVNLNYPFNSQAALVVSDYSTLANPSSYGPTFRLNSWSIDVENSVLADDGYRPGAGRYYTVLSPSASLETVSITIAVTSVTAGTLAVVVTALGMSNSPKTVSVTLAGAETAAQVATKIRAALAADSDVGFFFTVGGTGVTVTLTTRKYAANDTSAAITIAALLGVSSASSTITIPGVVESSDPASGAVRSELLVGTRQYSATFDVRIGIESGALAALHSQKPLNFALTAIGGTLGSGNYSFAVNIGLVHYETVDVSEKNGLIDVQIKATILADATAGFSTINFQLSNNTATYLS